MRTYWLASYPKSGNTWFRIFLSNLLFPEQAPVDPNQLPLRNLIASARTPFHEIIGVPSSLLTMKESEHLRPQISQTIGRDWSGPVCVRKTHDAYTFLEDGRPLMGTHPEFAAIYIVRNPWDVAVSAASHWQQPIEQVVRNMCNDETILDNRKDRVTSQLPQRLLSWSNHVRSWVSAPINVCVLRYEDLHAQPVEHFGSAVRFLGLSADDLEIERAVEASRFDRLQSIEQQHGFREAPKSSRFFRKGEVGEGQSKLDEKSRERLARQNEIVERVLQNRRHATQ